MTEREITEEYEKYVDMVYRICFTYLKNPYDTQEAVQDTFVKFMTNKKNFQSEEHKKAWLIVDDSKEILDKRTVSFQDSGDTDGERISLGILYDSGKKILKY